MAKCKGCCLGGPCYVRNTLHIYTILQQNCGTSLLHEQGHPAGVLVKIVVLLGFRTNKHCLAKIYLLIKLIGAIGFPFLKGNTHIGFGSSILGCFKWEFGSRSVGKAGKDWKKHRKSRYATTT